MGFLRFNHAVLFAIHFQEKRNKTRTPHISFSTIHVGQNLMISGKSFGLEDEDFILPGVGWIVGTCVSEGLGEGPLHLSVSEPWLHVEDDHPAAYQA